ncbi:hypothetical protein N0V83_000790 [Neocucurbitaria cava]|uniref:GED domain-containing protein n=1 Tax=Neocucurbitaria cava TaxID=798079 RepID=A0A9W9CRF7_9PLEO|nr:hypothetical protein N0V83_000790 [Neocucurbitaria cava]
MRLGDQDIQYQQLPQLQPPATSGIDALGKYVKEAISTINRLEKLGLQKLRIPLPKCIVLGEQSTGKSSVIEAISGIKTPRSEGTTTKCPLFIKLEPSEDPNAPWSAQVTLRRDFFYDGKPGKGPGRRFFGWGQLQQSNEIDFATTTDPGMLEQIITRAQSALVNPQLDYREFLLESAPSRDKDRLRFSPNIVSISITQPGLPALSFYDLPGVIGQAESESEQFLVKFVRDLVVGYVKDPEALILVTYSLEGDIANSTAGGIARELRATNRCIGVLTKPDRIQQGSCPAILYDLLAQKRFELGHGYFVVRNLGPDQIHSLTHEAAQLQEEHFFSQTELWATHLRQYESRFGSANLRNFLAGKLAEQITNKIPVIHEEISARLQDVDVELQQYPEPPTRNALRIILDTLLDFTQHVRKELEAEFPCKEWRNDWKGQQEKFFKDLVSMKPRLATSGRHDTGIYFETLGAQSGRSKDDSIVIGDDSDDEDNEREEDAQMLNPETPKKRKLEGTPVHSPMKTPRSGNTGLTKARDDSTRPSVNADLSELRTVFRLDEVAQHLGDASKSRIPGQIEPRVICDMMLGTLEHWYRPLDAFFNTFALQLRTHVQTLFHQHFSKWAGSALFHNAWKIVEQMLNLNFHQQRTSMADESLNDEKEGPYIFHEGLFEREKEEMLVHYRRARFAARLNMYRRERTQNTGKPVTPQEEERIKKDEKIMSVLNREPYDVELRLIAQISSYYTIASRRFHDAVCMRIESKFFKQLRLNLREELENGLGINDGSEGHQNAIRLLAEPPERQKCREELTSMRNALLQGQQILKDLQEKKYGEDTASLDSMPEFSSGITSFPEAGGILRR